MINWISLFPWGRQLVLCGVLTVLSFTPLCGGSQPPKPDKVWVLDIRQFSQDERLTALCLQGILNRDRPRLYLDTGRTVRWMQLGIEGVASNYCWNSVSGIASNASCESVCNAWMDILSRRGICRFESATMEQLLGDIRAELHGVIIYEKLDEDLSIAATMAGLSNALPMTAALQARFGSQALPVICDIRRIRGDYPEGADARMEAHRWMIKNLLPLCNLNGALSRDKTYGSAAHDTLIDVDLAVQNRWMTYQLSYLSTETKNGSDKPLPSGGFDPPDKALLVEILDKLAPFSPVYGWGHPDENNLVRRLTMHNKVKVCTGTGNSSFYKHLPMMTSSLRQPYGHAEDKVNLENKCYVAFMVNEGDTLKYLASFCNDGSWLQQARGRLPINWGMDPLLYEAYPGLVSYYMATATSNDYFFAAPSGWGYAHPERLADDKVMPYAALVKRGGEIADLRYIDIWWMGGLRKKNLFYPFINATGMRGLTQWTDCQRAEYAPDGLPIVHSHEYYTLKNPAEFAGKLTDELRDIKLPWFIVVYGGDPDKFLDVMQRLPSDKFKAVKLDEFFAAARLARPQMEGRKWMPGGKRTVNAAPGAGGGQSE